MFVSVSRWYWGRIRKRTKTKTITKRTQNQGDHSWLLTWARCGWYCGPVSEPSSVYLRSQAVSNINPTFPQVCVWICVVENALIFLLASDYVEFDFMMNYLYSSSLSGSIKHKSQISPLICVYIFFYFWNPPSKWNSSKMGTENYFYYLSRFVEFWKMLPNFWSLPF